MGRGRDPRRSAQQQPGGGRNAPYGQSGPYGQGQYGGRPAQPPYPGGNPQQGGQRWPAPPAPPSDEPEYFGQTGVPGGHPNGGYPNGGYPNNGNGYGPGDHNDNPGHTRAFTIGHGFPADPDDGHVATYRAGQTNAPPAGPRLPWKQLLSGIVLHPQRTFWQMRDYQVWAPALIVTFVYGLLAVFSFEEMRKEILEASTSTSIPQVLVTALAVTFSWVMLGAVTNALARQLGGDGAWAPTIGLSMLIMSMSDVPRLVFAVFLPADNGLVRILAWATWLLSGALLTTMVGKSHDLPWPRALGACSIQILALLGMLFLLKLPTS